MNMLHTARALAQKKFKIFPCKVGGKVPLTAHGCKDASCDPEQIERWWTETPDANIGLATGHTFFALDVDGEEGEASLRKLESELGPLPSTVEVITPSGGRHLYFQMPEAPVRNSAGQLGPHLDVRGTNAYCVCPPSVFNGRQYCRSVDSGRVIAVAPDWLLARVTQRASGNGKIPPTPPSEWRYLITNGVAEGKRDTSAARLAGHLLRRHVDPFVVLEMVRMWNTLHCRPPLPDGDIERVVDSISAMEMKRRHGDG